MARFPEELLYRPAGEATVRVLLVGTAQENPPSLVHSSAISPWTSTAPPAAVQKTAPPWKALKRPPPPDCSPEVGKPNGPRSQPVCAHSSRIVPCTACAWVAAVQ